MFLIKLFYQKEFFMPKLKRSCFYLLSYLFSEAKYNVINKPFIYISGTTHAFLSFAFDDSAEKVWIAGMGLSSKDMEKIINELKTIIHETLDLPVHVNGILIEPADTPTQTKEITYTQSQKDIETTPDDSYILIFKSIKEADDYLQANQNPIQKNTDHLPDSFLYYENVINYLSNNSYK